jgi:hypothetical protein
LLLRFTSTVNGFARLRTLYSHALVIERTAIRVRSAFK